jgi:F0F1-type ATP synthase beta subunit
MSEVFSGRKGKFVQLSDSIAGFKGNYKPNISINK